MCIGFDIRVLSTGRITGVEEYTLELAKHLLAVDTKNVYSFYYNGLSPLLNPYFKDKNVIYGKTPNKLLDLSFKFLSRPYIDERIQCKLFFSPHFLLTPLKSAQRILTVHDLSFIRFPEFFSLKHRFWLNVMEIKKQIKKAERIVVPSDCTKNDLITLLDVPEKKIERIYHGINPIFGQRYSEEELSEFKITHGLPKQYVLYLGTIEPRKNITTLIKAFELLCDDLPNVSLVLAGNLGWLFEQCLHTIDTSKYKNRIILTRVSSEDRPKLYQAAEVFVYPSFFEGFGFQPLEAQYSHIPVIASNRSSLPETLGDSALLVDPYNRLDLAEAIRTVLTEEKVRTNLIRKGRENAVQFNWGSAARHYAKLFNSL
ncbi:MAG: glycosyltransferase family 4 protein [Parcubacteria group bacterium]|nr:glycosyltransferase family 4 protein [Parcubacteria group bacterium]